MARQLIGAEQMSRLNDALREVSDDIADLMLSLLEDMASRVAQDAGSRVPVLSGRARATYKAQGTSVGFGSDTTPYVPWLEFGGRVGRNRSVLRAYNPRGRFLYPAIATNLADVERFVDDLISQATNGFLEVEG